MVDISVFHNLSTFCGKPLCKLSENGLFIRKKREKSSLTGRKVVNIIEQAFSSRKASAVFLTESQIEGGVNVK